VVFDGAAPGLGEFVGVGGQVGHNPPLTPPIKWEGDKFILGLEKNMFFIMLM
jgi:hypothetical protein